MDVNEFESPFVQPWVMAWCCLATSHHYLNQWWPTSVTPYDMTRLQWINPKLLYLQYISTGVTAVLHQATDIVKSTWYCHFSFVIADDLACTRLQGNSKCVYQQLSVLSQFRLTTQHSPEMFHTCNSLMHEMVKFGLGQKKQRLLNLGVSYNSYQPLLEQALITDTSQVYKAVTLTVLPLLVLR